MCTTIILESSQGWKTAALTIPYCVCFFKYCYIEVFMDDFKYMRMAIEQAKIAYSLYYINSTKFDHLEPYLLFANLPVFMILVWFTWFCSKQFSYTKQICDEYEYKYALSKSYLSYRDEAKNVSDNDRGKYDAIMVSLLDSVIKNIATSPVKSVKPDCHTPFTEVFGSLKDIIKTTDKKD